MDFVPHKCQEEDETLYFTKYCTPWSCFCIDAVTAERLKVITLYYYYHIIL